MYYTLRQIQVFLAVAQHENVTHAARELAMSQSAVSTALKELEQRFDILLFDRIGKRLQLNEQGILLRTKAAGLIAQAEELQQSLLKHSGVGDLKVGATPAIGNYLAVSIMAKFLSEYPDARVELSVENSAAIAKRVKNLELDIGLIEGELQEPDLEIRSWRGDELVLFCSPTHPLAQKPDLDDLDLLQAEWVIREQGSGTRQAFDRAMSGILSDLELKLELQHTEGIKRAVEAGLGVGCLSRITLDDAFQRGSLIQLKAAHRNWSRKFYFVLRKQKFLSRSVTSWIARCMEY
ncbi:MAG: LysR substrate-binding domain-containing protein [Gammaproteobacteria bacterium]|jgi:DNA-binding transcriptional LysR family regulator|nr:LysR family transcriptional regulator [Gammaproteobacteria bacterium]MDP6094930.1 LysR substrate-binding domain-containing protein [Gammaproteobacteria bacterium]MDP7456207.1 LysR substrate-binding domain-containing protein [Gammaproteobacteria bacterium]HJO11187.1 LysR substrate-binding domain-containing protein [Gammaproteobacteria bacterium]|tara:strand:- start:8890 stop:9768 length:879 start_codon:yes stop_codon:yes gene_type:complete